MLAQGSQDASVRHIIPLDQNLVDEIWGVQRPVLPSSSVYAHPKEFRGERGFSQRVACMYALDPSLNLQSWKPDDRKKLLVFRPYTVRAESFGISVGSVSAGLSTREKVARTVQTMAKEGADLLLLSVSLHGLLWRGVPAVC